MYSEAQFTQAVNRNVNILVWVVFPGSRIKPKPTRGTETADKMTEAAVSLQFLPVFDFASPKSM